MPIVAFASVYLLKMASPKAALEPKPATAVIFILTTDGWVLPHLVHNIQSQGLGSSATPAPVFVVVCSTIGFFGIVNPKAVLEPKATAAVTSI